MKKWFLVPLFLLIAAVIIFTSCGGGTTTPTATQPTPTATKPTITTPATTTPPTEPYGTLTVAVADFAQESLDPCNVESTWGWGLYDALLRWDATGKLVPGVADTWTLEGNTWTFKIHKGIKFWNGDPLTAADVKFSMDRFSDLAQSTNPWSYFVSKVYNQVETKVVDDYTFQFVQAHPEPSQIIIMAWTRILPKKYFESVGVDAFRKAPIGSGPWKFKELKSKTSITFEANTDYWIKDEIPHFQYFKELMVPELATRISMLKTGEVDMIAFPDLDQINNLKAAGFTAYKIGVPGTCSLALQGSWLPNAGPIGDIRVRQAMSYAINRKELSDKLYAGYATPGGQFYMYPGGYGWSDALGPDPYNTQKAKDLLKEAGYPDKFPNPTITCYTTAPGGLSGGPDLFLLLISYWEAVGLKVELRVVDSTIFTGYIFNGFTRFKGDEKNVGWIGCWNYDAFFNSTYQAANMYCSWGVHNAGNDPKADELYKKATGEMDPVKGAQYFNDFQVYAKSMYVNIGVAQTDAYVVWDPKKVGGWADRTWVSYWDATFSLQHAK
jgi:peptide/nickel transport system substrate-binding protein